MSEQNTDDPLEGWERETLIARLGEEHERYHGAISPPIFQSSLFTFPDSESVVKWFGSERFYYTRVGNPTNTLLEQKLAALEGGERAIVTASGMGAIAAAIMACVESSIHIVCIDTVYGPTRSLFENLKKRFQIGVSYVEGKSVSDFEQAITDQTRLIYLESPSSFLFSLQDLEGVAKLAKERNIVTICDNSWATPWLQNPLQWGIDLVIHSATKYIGGHSDTLGGAIIGSGALIKRIADWELPLFGASADPFASWQMIKGLRTLPVRLERHESNAREVGAFLEAHPQVDVLYWPGAQSFDQKELAQKQMRGLAGVMSVKLKDASRENTFRFVDSLRLFSIGCSWGGYESLVIPHTPRAGEWIARLSIGLENSGDLIRDLASALEKLNA